MNSCGTFLDILEIVITSDILFIKCFCLKFHVGPFTYEVDDFFVLPKGNFDNNFLTFVFLRAHFDRISVELRLRLISCDIEFLLACTFIHNATESTSNEIMKKHLNRN